MPGKPKMPPGLLDYFSSLGKAYGSKGGKKRAENLSPKERREIAVKAAKTRWAKKKAKGGGR